MRVESCLQSSESGSERAIVAEAQFKFHADGRQRQVARRRFVVAALNLITVHAKRLALAATLLLRFGERAHLDPARAFLYRTAQK